MKELRLPTRICHAIGKIASVMKSLKTINGVDFPLTELLLLNVKNNWPSEVKKMIDGSWDKVAKSVAKIEDCPGSAQFHARMSLTSPSVDYVEALDIVATGMRLLKSHDRKHWAVLPRAKLSHAFSHIVMGFSIAWGVRRS